MWAPGPGDPPRHRPHAHPCPWRPPRLCLLLLPARMAAKRVGNLQRQSASGPIVGIAKCFPRQTGDNIHHLPGTISIISWGQYPSSLGTTAIIPWKNSHRLLGSAQDRAGPGLRGVFPSAQNIRLRPAADVGRGAGGTPLELQSGHHGACAAGSRGLWCCGCSSCPLEGGGPQTPAGLGHAGMEQCTPRCTPQLPPRWGPSPGWGDRFAGLLHRALQEGDMVYRGPYELLHSSLSDRKMEHVGSGHGSFWLLLCPTLDPEGRAWRWGMCDVLPALGSPRAHHGAALPVQTTVPSLCPRIFIRSMRHQCLALCGFPGCAGLTAFLLGIPAQLWDHTNCRGC